MRTGRVNVAGRTAGIATLALISAGWTANVAGVGAAPVASAQAPSPFQPVGTSVPTEAIEAPASVSDGNTDGAGGNTEQIVANSTANAIPSAALAAYQRAETVINAADKTCNLTWQLVGAIGRVESNHGRFAGSVLNDQGTATPAIYGPALNGSPGIAKITDTDAGQYDNDTRFDRAVGPMQFIPSTWSVVGVDADGDGKRDPQDVDDAALATAVYLCSGDEDLSTTAGQRASVYRYNNSDSYVDLVLAIMNNYLEGDYTSIPDNTIAGDTIPDATFTGAGTGDPLFPYNGGSAGVSTGRYVPRSSEALGSSVRRGPRDDEPGAGDEEPGNGSGDVDEAAPDATAPDATAPDATAPENGAPTAPVDPEPTEPTQPPAGDDSDPAPLVSPEAAEACVALLGLNLDPADVAAVTDAAALEALADGSELVTCVETFAVAPWDPANPPALSDLLATVG